jgi:hypothetical protein
MQQNVAALYGGINVNATMPLSTALRPNMVLDNHHVSQNQHLLNMNIHNSLNKFEMVNPQHAHHSSALVQQLTQSQGIHGMQYSNSQSTADIVNAAIAALRYAN